MGCMGYDNAHGWIRFIALLLIFIMGILNIVFPRNLLKINLAPTYFKKLNGRQDHSAVYTVRVVGIVMILISIMNVAYSIWRFYS